MFEACVPLQLVDRRTRSHMLSPRSSVLLSRAAPLLSPFITHPPTDKATLWRSRDSAGGPGPVGQVETAARKTDSLTRGVKLSGRAPGSSWPAPVLTTLSKSSTSTSGLFSTANTDTIMSLSCRRTHGLKATGRSVALRPQLLAGKPFTPCDSQLSLGSVAGHTHTHTDGRQSVSSTDLMFGSRTVKTL